ncbi:type II secretion system F family protein, partial [Candidatus Saccharibacteria bacterium]|nr:type II secretion system F family protein [Candidatus Saccharibacteria bacterium]
MLTYKYIARDPATGQKIKAEIQADSEKAAAKLLHEQHMVPISLTLQEEGGALGGRFSKKVKTKDKILFS